MVAKTTPRNATSAFTASKREQKNRLTAKNTPPKSFPGQQNLTAARKNFSTASRRNVRHRAGGNAFSSRFFGGAARSCALFNTLAPRIGDTPFSPQGILSLRLNTRSYPIMRCTHTNDSVVANIVAACRLFFFDVKHNSFCASPNIMHTITVVHEKQVDDSTCIYGTRTKKDKQN